MTWTTPLGHGLRRRTSWPRSRHGCGRPTTGANRPGCSAGSSFGLRAQARVSWPRALARQPVADAGRRRASPGRPATTSASRPISRAATGCSACPTHVDADEVARRELRWWVVRREIGLAAGSAAGDAITWLYAEIYGFRSRSVAEAGRLRGQAAEVRDRGAPRRPGRFARLGARLLAGGRPPAAGVVSDSLADAV